MIYLSDFPEDATVYFLFTTNAGDGGRESFSATLEEADIVIFKDGSAMTLDASTITITNDIGGRVGVHAVSVDMSNDADFTTGAEYAAVLYASDETLDSQAPAGVLAHWSCENRTVAALSGHTPQTGDSFARLGAPAGASVSADIAAIWTSALTEAYRATGSEGTAAQLLYEIMAHVGEFAISGTTKTTKQLDGSTTAKTYTLDDATNPTSITEAT